MIRVVLALALVLGATAPAYADARAEAILLFDQAQKDMKAGKYAEACRRFAKSNALYPDSGTKGSLARCYAKLGKLGSSWLLWRELADTAPTPELRQDAARRAARLDPKVPKYVVRVAATVPGLVVTINGTPVNVTGLPVPIDAGPIAAAATAPGHEGWKAERKAENGKTITIEVPPLVAVEPPPDERVIERPPPPPPPVRVLDTSRRRKRRVLAASIAGAGVAAAIAGGVFGLSARGSFAEANDVCGGSVDACLPERVAEAQVLVDDARGAATLSTILVGVGGAAIVTGAVLWFTAPGPEERLVTSGRHSGFARARRAKLAPVVAPGTAGFVVTGRF